MKPEYEIWIRSRFAASSVASDPFPHLVIRDVLPPDLYAQMVADCPGGLAHAVASVCATRLRPLRRYWQQPMFAVRPGNPSTLSLGRYAKRWQANYQPYIDLVDRLTIAAYAPAADRLLRQLAKAGFVRDNSAMRIGQGIFTHRTETWRIPPHVHDTGQIIQSMIYFPLPGSVPEQGTVLYRLKRPKSVNAPELMRTFLFSDDEVEEAGSMPYHPNTLASFLNTPLAIHATPDVKGPARRYTFTAAVVSGVRPPAATIDLQAAFG